jgi:hypothetical protein
MKPEHVAVDIPCAFVTLSPGTRYDAAFLVPGTSSQIAGRGRDGTATHTLADRDLGVRGTATRSATATLEELDPSVRGTATRSLRDGRPSGCHPRGCPRDYIGASEGNRSTRGQPPTPLIDIGKASRFIR